ncbi:Sodium/calcium exchanger NCL [Cardamine amara subsp. amara]|uniref:Sodium/calcium exchanger NCL n=1 Tax=Cardamine amara subsp. amara TaxID=228776 RepID=A0ABD1BBM9_CARAN
MAQLVLFLTSFFLAIVGLNCRVLGPAVSENNLILLVSDGFENQQEILNLEPHKIKRTLTREACVHLYGFLPCADNVIGYAFQVFSFGSLLIVGDYFLSKGRSKLLDIFEVGLYGGGIIFPPLKIFPLIALTLVTSLSTSQEVAQSMIVD